MVIFVCHVWHACEWQELKRQAAASIQGWQQTLILFTCIQDDVETAKRILKDKLESPKWPQYAHLRDHVIPMTLYSQQKPQLTKDAVAKGRPDKRRVVFSTNVAETSLTIDGVTVVVDAGFTKESLYDHQKRMKILQVPFILFVSTTTGCSRLGA